MCKCDDKCKKKRVSVWLGGDVGVTIESEDDVKEIKKEVENMASKIKTRLSAEYIK